MMNVSISFASYAWSLEVWYRIFKLIPQGQVKKGQPLQKFQLQRNMTWLQLTIWISLIASWIYSLMVALCALFICSMCFSVLTDKLLWIPSIWWRNSWWCACQFWHWSWNSFWFCAQWRRILCLYFQLSSMQCAST